MLSIINSKQLTLPESAEAWLQELHSTTVVECEVEGSHEWRVISVLVHGNEPSGFFAAFNFLKHNIQPKTNLAFIISSIRAAKTEPQFTHRFVPGEYDLNRRFGIAKCHDRVTELAQYITQYIRSKNPSMVVDLHNTSGSGPAFAVSVSDHPEIKQLASIFTSEMVITQLIVGSLMEQNFNCPVVTIECGGANDQASHQMAFEGLVRFTQTEKLEQNNKLALQIFKHPARVKAHQGIALHFGTANNDDFDIVLLESIEQFNYRTIQAGTSLGWINRSLTDCIEVINDHGDNIVEELFKLEQGQLICQNALRVFMATARADIALSDCLFYVVEL